MHRGSPKVPGGFYPWLPDFWACPSQVYPYFMPRKVTCALLLPYAPVVERWENHFAAISRVGVPSVDRLSVVYDFDPDDPAVPRYSSCRARAIAGPFGYWTQEWTFVFGLATPLLSYNYLWGPRTMRPMGEQLGTDVGEFGDGLETVHGLIVSDCGALIRPCPWHLV